MNRHTLAALVTVVACVLAVPVAAGQAQVPAVALPRAEFVAGEILVKFKPGIPEPDVADVHRQNGGRVKEVIPGIDVQVVAVRPGEETSRAAAYQRNPNVLFAEVNGLARAVGVPNDPRAGEQWQYNNTGQTGGTSDADIDAYEAWDSTAGTESTAWCASGSFEAENPHKIVAIAILDTGIDHHHDDFHYRASDGNLRSKICKWVNYTDSRYVDDIHGHGTHVAGSAAAATGNARGVAGVCRSCVLFNVKVLGDTGSGGWSWIANGIVWATSNGASVINMSLGTSSGSRTLEEAVAYAWNNGVVVVAAAGNDGTTSAFYPAYYSNVIAVAATDHKDARASFSNTGDWVDVAAPGVNILSTTVGGTFGNKSGTSMAAPHVAGLAGLVWSTSYGISNAAVRNRIESTADDIPGTGSYWADGRVNACKAVGGC